MGYELTHNYVKVKEELDLLQILVSAVYNGLCEEAPPKRGPFFRLLYLKERNFKSGGIWNGREICHWVI